MLRRGIATFSHWIERRRNAHDPNETNFRGCLPAVRRAGGRSIVPRQTPGGRQTDSLPASVDGTQPFPRHATPASIPIWLILQRRQTSCSHKWASLPREPRSDEGHPCPLPPSQSDLLPIQVFAPQTGAFHPMEVFPTFPESHSPAGPATESVFVWPAGSLDTLPSSNGSRSPGDCEIQT